MGFQVATRGHSLLCEPVDLRRAHFLLVVFVGMDSGVSCSSVTEVSVVNVMGAVTRPSVQWCCISVDTALRRVVVFVHVVIY